MAMRTATAVGSIRSQANVEVTFRVNLWIHLFDEDGSTVVGYPRAVDDAIVILGAGEESGIITLTGSAYLAGDWEMLAWVTLDRISPYPANGIDSTPQTSYVETVLIGGMLVGFSPGILAQVDELLAEIPELDELLSGIPG